MNDYGKALKRISFKELLRQRDLWRLRSKENRWFYSLPMHLAVVAEIKKRERARKAFESSMSYIELSDREVEIIRHSLGWNRDRIAYRNYFAADRGSEDDATWLGLVKRGLAIGRETSVTPDRTYSVGLRAANAVRRDGEILDLEVAAKLSRIDRNIQKIHGPVESSNDR